MSELVGPECEQLGFDEDIERLAAIGDLILDDGAQIDNFELGHYERCFVLGYVEGGA